MWYYDEENDLVRLLTQGCFSSPIFINSNQTPPDDAEEAIQVAQLNPLHVLRVVVQRETW